MKKIKFVISAMVIAFFLTFSLIIEVRADNPCTDGQVPIGSKTCSLRIEPPSETDKEKQDSIFEIMIEWFNGIGF